MATADYRRSSGGGEEGGNEMKDPNSIFERLKREIPIDQYLADQGVTITGNRFAATWHGSNAHNCQFYHNDDGTWSWNCFSHGEGGSILDLAKQLESLDPKSIETVRELARRYGVQFDEDEKKMEKKQQKNGGRSQYLAAAGYTKTAVYHYCDEHGQHLYDAERWEKPGVKKEFVQKQPNGIESIKGIPRVPYNLVEVIKSTCAIYHVEGEKDVETLRRLGIVATCNSGGASTVWNEEYNKYFAGRDAVIIPDNDEPGRKHAKKLADILSPIAASVKIVEVSKLDKGDVTDYLEKEGGTLDGLLTKVAAAPFIEKIPADVAAAKLANETPFQNYTIETDEDGHERLRARLITHMRTDIFTRCLNFPRKLGNALFDYHEGKLTTIYTAEDLTSWLDECTQQPSDFIARHGFSGPKKLYSNLMQYTREYAAIADTPHYPTRDDVFYTFGELPPPAANHAVFWKLIDSYNHTDSVYRCITAAMFLAPLWSNRGNVPAFIVDTDDAQGAGKTTLASGVVELYGGAIAFTMKDLQFDFDRLKKRFVSADGRRCRIGFADNLTGKITSASLAELVTCGGISTIAPYGRGEEFRPNDLTYLITANGAIMDADMADRCYTTKVSRLPEEKKRSAFDVEMRAFIDENRLQILADGIDIIKNAKFHKSSTRRFKLFDETILSAVCASEAEFDAVAERLTSDKQSVNDDAVIAEDFRAAIDKTLDDWPRMSGTVAYDENYPAILTDSLLLYVAAKIPALEKWSATTIHQRIIKTGLLTDCSTADEFHTKAKPHLRGLFLGLSRQVGDSGPVQILDCSRSIGGAQLRVIGVETMQRKVK